MPTDLQIKYRPIRIGFLVRAGNIDDLVTVAGINTLLFGGIYNPIIPISEDNELSKQLIKVFNVDILHEVAEDVQLKNFSSEYKFDRDPFSISNNLFYEEWNSKKNYPIHLDSLHLIQHNLERISKNNHSDLNSEYAYPIWNENHSLKDLFSICFGHYPTKYNLKDNFDFWFNKGLHPFSFNLDPKSKKDKHSFQIDPSILERITPIKLTGTELSGNSGKFRDNGVGIFVGDNDDFQDLCWFWNLRAMGIFVEFLPMKFYQNYKSFIDTHLRLASNKITDLTRITNTISAYCRHEKYEFVKQFIEALDHQLHPFPCDIDVIWNGLNTTMNNPFFSSQYVLSSVAKSDDSLQSTFGLPPVPIINKQRPETNNQSLVASLHFPSESSAYSEHTLTPPPIRELNAFYGEKVLSHTFKVKSEETGLRIIIRPNENSLSLTPIHYSPLIKRIFKIAEIEATLSQPGNITDQIIRKLNGIEKAWFLKITGVRKLLNSLSKDKAITKGEATKIIHQGSFSKFENLFLGRKLTANFVFDFLLKKELFRAGLELTCQSCNLTNWLNLREIDDIWECGYCGSRDQTSLYLNNRGDWKFRKSGLFAKDNNQEGAIPVILTLLILRNCLAHSRYLYSPALKLNLESKECETDFCVVTYDSMNRIRVGIAECKSEGGEISNEDVYNLKLVAEKFAGLGIETTLIFSKTADRFTPDELNLFKSVREEHIPCILLTKNELESHLFSAEAEGDSWVKYPSSLNELAINSSKKYLDE